MLDIARILRPSIPLIASAVLLSSAAAKAGESSPAGRQVVVEGELEVLQSCDFGSKGHDELSYFLRDAAGEQRYELKLPASNRTRRLLTGMHVRVSGTENGARIDASSSSAAGGLTVLSATTSASSTVSGARSAVVLLVNFVDGAVACSASQVAGTLYSNAQNVNGYFQESSFGALSFNPDADGNGSPDVFTVSIPNSVTEACSYMTWAANADAAATASGVNLALYQHHLYVLPQTTTNCTWGGVADMGCTSGACRSWVKYCGTPDIYAHEIGHNLGLAHSSSDLNNDGVIDNEYGDSSDPMGTDSVGWRHNNAPHKYQEGWFPAGKVVDVVSGGTYALAAMEAAPATTGFPQVLRIPKPDAPGTEYYVSFRQPLGSYSTNLSTGYAGRTSIQKYTSGSANTLLVTVVGDGQIFTDPVNGITISQVSHDATSATVQVSTTCAAGVPKITFTPSSQTGKSGASAGYTVTVANTDSTGCGGSTFSFSGLVPTGWTGNASIPSLTLAPAAQGTVTLSVTSSPTSTQGTYGVSFATTDATQPAHSASASGTYLVDNQPPNAVTNLSATLTRQRKVQLTWTVPSDNGGSGIVKYSVYRNAGTSPFATTATTSYFDGAVTSGAAYSYYVLAVDAAGNVSAKGNTVTVTAK